MADYIPITEAQSDPEAAVDSSLIKRLRDNPLAIAEGAAGAPRILGSSRKHNLLASANFTTPALSYEITDLVPHTSIIFFAYEIDRGASDTVNLEISQDNGSTWVLVRDRTISSGGDSVFFGELDVFPEQGMSLYNIIFGRLSSPGPNFERDIFEFSSPINAVRIRKASDFDSAKIAVYASVREVEQ